MSSYLQFFNFFCRLFPSAVSSNLDFAQRTMSDKQPNCHIRSSRGGGSGGEGFLEQWSCWNPGNNIAGHSARGSADPWQRLPVFHPLAGTKQQEDTLFLVFVHRTVGATWLLGRPSDSVGSRRLLKFHQFNFFNAQTWTLLYPQTNPWTTIFAEICQTVGGVMFPVFQYFLSSCLPVNTEHDEKFFPDVSPVGLNG